MGNECIRELICHITCSSILFFCMNSTPLSIRSWLFCKTGKKVIYDKLLFLCYGITSLEWRTHKIRRTEDKMERFKTKCEDEKIKSSCTVLDWRQETNWKLQGDCVGVVLPPCLRLFCAFFTPILRTRSCLIWLSSSYTAGDIIKQMKVTINRIWWTALVTFMK